MEYDCRIKESVGGILWIKYHKDATTLATLAQVGRNLVGAVYFQQQKKKKVDENYGALSNSNYMYSYLTQ